MTVRCPRCSGRTQVLSSRPSGGEVLRRRRCRLCGQRLTTFERVLKVGPASRGPRENLAGTSGKYLLLSTLWVDVITGMIFSGTVSIS